MNNKSTTGTDQYVLIFCVLWTDGMKPRFLSATDVLTVTVTEFVIDKVSTSQIMTVLELISHLLPGISGWVRGRKIGDMHRRRSGWRCSLPR